MRKRKEINVTEQDLRKAVQESISLRQVLIVLKLPPDTGGSYRIIHSLIKKYEVDISHFKGMGWSKNLLKPTNNIEDYLSNKKKITSHKLRIKLLREKIFNYQCSFCLLKEWLNNPIPLELDHIDGNHLNNNLSNLRLLCPNCHVFTPTYKSKNRHK